MKLWLDDKRPAPDSSWRLATDATAARSLLIAGDVTFASLDHDLGLLSETGYWLICWMEERGCWPVDGVRVHSMNPVGRQQMETVIRKHYGRNW